MNKLVELDIKEELEDLYYDAKSGEGNSITYHKTFEEMKELAKSRIEKYNQALSNYERFHSSKELIKDKLIHEYMFNEEGVFLTSILSLSATFVVQDFYKVVGDQSVCLTVNNSSLFQPEMDAEGCTIKLRLTALKFIPQLLASHMSTTAKVGDPRGRFAKAGDANVPSLESKI